MGFYETVQQQTLIYTNLNPEAELNNLLESVGVRSKIKEESILNYIPRWPLIVHHLCAIFCLGASAIYHLVWIKNERILNLFAKLDYGGIFLLIMGSAYPLTYYAFACEKVFWIRNFFFFINTSSNLSCFCVLMIPKF